MGGACSTYGGIGEGHIGFWWGNQTEIDHLEDLSIDGKIILKWILKTWEWEYGMDCYG